MTDPGCPLPLLFLAPMAGVTNPVFRRICKREGVDVLTSEFVSAEGILHRNLRTREYLEFDETERPFGVQLFGADPVRLGEAARAVVDWVGPDFIDLNFGCPVNKVVCREGGSALLRNCPLLEAVAREVVRAVAPVPVSAKIRIGWDEASINATTTAKLLEDAGVVRIAVHGRTKEQGYSGHADWNVIAQVAGAVRVPVVGNGDIASAADALRRWKESGVAGLMIGRAAMTAPWLFAQIRAALRGLPVPPDPSPTVRWSRILAHCEEEVAWRGSEDFAMRSMRSRLMAYSRGMPAGRSLRGLLSHVKTLAELREIADRHLETCAD
jgi:nifR3 family TIM-barrel protein